MLCISAVGYIQMMPDESDTSDKLTSLSGAP